MPRVKVDSARKATKVVKKEPTPRKLVMNHNDSVCSDESFEENSPAVTDNSKNVEDEEECPPDFKGEMSKLLERFGTDVNKTMQAKRRKLEQFTQEKVELNKQLLHSHNSNFLSQQQSCVLPPWTAKESTRSTTKKVLETNKNQSLERRKLIEHFQNQLNAMVHQGESELEKVKEAEERLQKLLLQQQKHQQQIRIAHSQKMKALRNLSEQFCKGMNELEESHVEQYSSVHDELRKEMAALQKKMLMETQQQEMMNVRKHLKNIIP